MLANSSGWPWRRNKREEQDWRMIQLGSGWPWRKKARLEEKVATTQHICQVIFEETVPLFVI